MMTSFVVDNLNYMYTISFYIDIKNLPKILEYINILWEEFVKIFGTPFDGVAYTDLQKFLKLAENMHNEIYYVPTINDNWPTNHIKFWDDSFSISLLISVQFFDEIPKKYNKMKNDEDFQDFSNDVQIFVDNIVQMLPLLGMDFTDWDEPFEKGWTSLLDENIATWIYFWYVMSDNRLQFIPWKN